MHVFLTAVVLLLTLSSSGRSSSSIEIDLRDRHLNRIVDSEVRLLSIGDKILFSKKFTKDAPVYFDRLSPGFITIEVIAPGFEIFRKTVEIKDGRNLFTFKLTIRKVEERVLVKESEYERRLNQVFNRYLSQQEIDSLPGSPSEIRKELLRRFGDDVLINVNGFTGGQIPPKESIRSIQVSRSSFDAEFHELGRPRINILTKASIPNLIAGIGLNYGNSIFNARNSFAKEKPPERNRLFFGFVTGPINKKSSFSFSFSNSANVHEEPIIARSSRRASLVRVPSESTANSFSGDINWDLGNNLTLRVNQQYAKTAISNSGVGGFSLPERGYSSVNRSHETRMLANGTVADRYTIQFRARFYRGALANRSNSDEVGITVADNFNAGGAGINNSSLRNRFEIFQMISVGWGRHLVKFGGEWRREHRDLSSSNGINGRFFFKSFEDFTSGRPSTYNRSEKSRDLRFSRSDLSLFLQDDFRVFKRMQLGFGLRYESQNRLSDRNNFSPRLSAAYVLDKKARFVLRTGLGFLYDWYDSAMFERVLSNDGKSNSQLVVIDPGFPDPAIAGEVQEKPAPSILRQADNLTNPYIFVTQTVLAMNFGGGLRLNAAYKYSRGTHLFRSRDTNAPENGIRPNPAFGRIVQLESSGNSFRNAFELSGSGVLLKRIRIHGRYRLARIIDDIGGSFSLPSDNYNLALDRGISNLDRRHYFSSRFDYSPFSDFRINPTIVVESPEPYTITTGLDNNGDTVFNDRPATIKRNSERGKWTKTANLSLNWAIPLFKRRSKVPDNRGSASRVPDSLKYHKINLTVNINNLFNTTNPRGFVGNQISPFFRQPVSAAPAHQISFNLVFTFF